MHKQLDGFFGNCNVKWPRMQIAEEEEGVAATETPQLLDTIGSVHKKKSSNKYGRFLSPKSSRQLTTKERRRCLS